MHRSYLNRAVAAQYGILGSSAVEAMYSYTRKDSRVFDGSGRDPDLRVDSRWRYQGACASCAYHLTVWGSSATIVGALC